MIAAILLAQWRSQRAFGIGAKRIGTWFALLIGLVYYSFWVVGAFGAASFFARTQDRQLMGTVLASALMGIILYWQLAPLVTASLGSSLDLKKLLVYPVPHGKLFIVEILLRVTTVLEMLVVSIGVSAGVALNPMAGPYRWARALLAFCLLLMMNAFFASGLRSLIERVLKQRRFRQVLFLFFLIVALTPQLLLLTHFDFARAGQYMPNQVFWPWSALANLMMGVSALQSATLALAFTALALRFGRWQFFRSLREPDAEATAAVVSKGTRQTNARFDEVLRLPSRLLPDPLGAMVEKEIRSLVRNARFRMVFFMGFSFGLLVWLPQIASGSGKHNVLKAHFLTVVAVYALVMLGQVSYWNCFGFDGVATQFYFSTPVPFRRVLVGKNLAVAVFTIAEMLLVLLMTALFRVGLNPFAIAEALCVTTVAAVYLFAFGNLTSVHLPRPMNAEKMMQGGASRSMNAALFLVAPLAMLPIVLAYWARYVFENNTVFFGLLALAGGLGAVLYWVALDSAAQSASRKREKMITSLSRGDGPLATN